MNPNRISVKYYIVDPAAVDLSVLIPVFHRWIQQSMVPGMLVDVADYQHMVEGPGVVLIGHDVDYALDMSQRRPGLLHTRKRCLAGDLNGCLASAFHSALLACRALEREACLGGKIRFRADEAKLVLPDRLHAPNRASTFDRLRGEIEGFLGSLYTGAKVRIERDAEDERRCLTIRIAAPGEPEIDTLIERLTNRVPGRG